MTDGVGRNCGVRGAVGREGRRAAACAHSAVGGRRYGRGLWERSGDSCQGFTG